MDSFITITFPGLEVWKYYPCINLTLAYFLNVLEMKPINKKKSIYKHNHSTIIPIITFTKCSNK